MLNSLFKVLYSALLLLVLISCSKDSFKIEGALSDAGKQTLRGVYVNEAGVQTVYATVEEGRFTFEGVSSNPTIFYIYNSQNKLLTKVVMKNGDGLKMRGTMSHNYLIEMKGSDENEDWNNFRRENHLLYQEGKVEELDKKIEEYIEANGKKIASLLLLLSDYSQLDDSKRVHDLLNKIDEKARPASILNYYTEMNSSLTPSNENRKKYHSFSLYNEKDSLESFVPLRNNMTVLYFWGNEDNSRTANIKELDTLYTDFGGKNKLQIADIMVDSDTARWKRSLRREKTEWKHYWAVGGLMNKSINDLMIKSTPQFMILDSIGTQIYRGDSISVVSRMVREHFKDVKPKKK